MKEEDMKLRFLKKFCVGMFPKSIFKRTDRPNRSKLIGRFFNAIKQPSPKKNHQSQYSTGKNLPNFCNKP